MEINARNMATLYTGISTQFREAFALHTDESWRQFAYLQPMSTGLLEMPFLEQIAGMREWVGPRKINRLSAQVLTVRARSFELTYELPREAVEDDSYGMYSSRLEQMAKSCAELPNDLLTACLENAASAKWLDNAAVFGTSRKYGKNAISNYTTSALSQESLKTAYTTMAAYQGHEGFPLRVRPTLLLHGPSLKFTVKELLESESVILDGEKGSAAVPNVTRGLVQSLEVPGLTGGKWFLCAASGVYKPLYYFERRRPDQIVCKDRETDENVFSSNTFVYGSYGRAEAAFVLPHLIYFGNPS